MLVGLALAHSAGSGLRPMRLGRAAVSALASSYGGETAPTFDNEWEHEMAGAEKLAKHVPAWAAEIMLDEAAGAEYEAEQARARAEAHVLVEGREWGDGGGAGGDGGDGEAFGSGAFTPAEIGDDYGAPLEAVLAKLLDLGVPERDLRSGRAPPSFGGGAASFFFTGRLLFLGPSGPSRRRAPRRRRRGSGHRSPTPRSSLNRTQTLRTTATLRAHTLCTHHTETLRNARPHTLRTHHTDTAHTPRPHTLLPAGARGPPRPRGLPVLCTEARGRCGDHLSPRAAHAN